MERIATGDLSKKGRPTKNLTEQGKAAGRKEKCP
jgi:hypothetical protein